MRVFFIGPPGRPRDADYKSEEQVGAIEQQLFNLSRELSEYHDVFLSRLWRATSVSETIDGVNIINIPPKIGTVERDRTSTTFSELINTVSYGLGVSKTIKNKNVDVIIISNIPSGLIPVKTTNETKKIFLNHSLMHFFGFKTQSISEIVKRRLSHQVIDDCERAIAVNNESADFIRKNYDIKTDIVPNGLELDNYSYTPEKEGYLMYSGRLLQRKKVADLVSSFHNIQNDINHDLLIVGEGERKRYLKNKVDELDINDRVRFEPFLDRTEYIKRIAGAECFILPSVEEEFGVVLIEAMACGTPVIARRTSGPESIIDHGFDGYLYDETDQLEEFLCEIDNNDTHQLKKNSRKKVEDNYTFEEITSDYQSVIEEIGCK